MITYYQSNTRFIGFGQQANNLVYADPITGLIGASLIGLINSKGISSIGEISLFGASSINEISENASAIARIDSNGISINTTLTAAGSSAKGKL